MKICKKCGLKFEDEMEYCGKCGQVLENEVLEAEVVEEVPSFYDGGSYRTQAEQLLDWNFWLSPVGRRNRKPYIIFSAVMWLLGGFLAALTALPLIGWAFGALLSYAYCISVVKRLHDVDMSGWWAVVPAVACAGSIATYSFILAFAVFVVNLGLWFYLLFKSGTQGDNKYGPDPLASK